MARNRKQPPKIVEWAQERILQKLLQFLAQGSQFSHGTSVTTDTKAVAVNDIRTSELISVIQENTKILKDIQFQLELLNSD